MLVRTGGRIATHGLVIHGNAAIHSAAADEIFKNVSDIIVLVFRAVLRANDRPAVVLCARWGAEKSDTCGHKKRRNYEDRIASGKLHFESPPGRKASASFPSI